jgi:PhzF family phenazine biosynthesis protein
MPPNRISCKSNFPEPAVGRSIYLVDAFTAVPFAGNPAGVCPVAGDWPEDLEAIAREMNQAETAFVRPRADGDWDLRWLTPTVEVDLCGHATLAAAHILWETARATESRLKFHTRSGILSASRVRDGIELDFPLSPVTETVAPPELLPSLGLTAAKFVGKTPFDWLIEIDSDATLRKLTPDFTDLGKIPTRGVIVTAPGTGTEYDFVSRFFGPAVGIDEDPVTGSAHCALAEFWGRKLGASEMVGFQASARGGIVRVKLNNDRVILSGQAVTVLSGELRV